MAISKVPLPLLFCDAEADRPASIGEGMLMFCKDTGKTYQFTDGDYMNYSSGGSSELPVGSIAMTEGANPAALYGYGTWQQIGRLIAEEV